MKCPACVVPISPLLQMMMARARLTESEAEVKQKCLGFGMGVRGERGEGRGERKRVERREPEADSFSPLQRWIRRGDEPTLVALGVWDKRPVVHVVRHRS